MIKLTASLVQKDLDNLPSGYKTADLDRLIAQYVKQRADASQLRDLILEQQQFHRIYFYVSLKQIKGYPERLTFIDKNLLFSNWWHTDQIIHFVAGANFDGAFAYAKGYVHSVDPYIRRWGYVLFISKLGQGKAEDLFPLFHNDEHYHVQMAQAWLIAELAIFQPETVLAWMTGNGLDYTVNGKAIQKICDSFRISQQWKEKFKALRPQLRQG